MRKPCAEQLFEPGPVQGRLARLLNIKAAQFIEVLHVASKEPCVARLLSIKAAQFIEVLHVASKEPCAARLLNP